MACYDTALQYAKTRKQFANKPIASHQLVQDKLAWMITEISKGPVARAARRAAERSKQSRSLAHFHAQDE